MLLVQVFKMQISCESCVQVMCSSCASYVQFVCKSCKSHTHLIHTYKCYGCHMLLLQVFKMQIVFMLYAKSVVHCHAIWDFETASFFLNIKKIVIYMYISKYAYQHTKYALAMVLGFTISQFFWLIDTWQL